MKIHYISYGFRKHKEIIGLFLKAMRIADNRHYYLRTFCARKRGLDCFAKSRKIIITVLGFSLSSVSKPFENPMFSENIRNIINSFEEGEAPITGSRFSSRKFNTT